MKDFLAAIPAHNEEGHLADVLERTLRFAGDVLVVDDGSTDATAEILAEFPRVEVVRHWPNKGYGAALGSAFDFAVERGFEKLVTLDADGQHLPDLIPDFVARANEFDIVSGSRYLAEHESDTAAPEERRRVNRQVTAKLNESFSFGLTDAFCGFKAYRTDALAQLDIREPGYGMPLELWVQAACRGLTITEVPVPRVYLDPNRSFGGDLDDANKRLAYYQSVIDAATARIRAERRCGAVADRAPTLEPLGVA